MKLLIKFAALAVATAVLPQVAAAQDCELDRPVVFAGLDWTSAALHNDIAQFILQKGYGCETDVVPGSTLPLLNGMIRGDIDVTMEMWRENVRDTYDPAVDAGEVFDLGTNFPDATQIWYVPKYLVDGPNAPAPDLKSVADLPKYKDLFADPEDPSKGRFYNCLIGWGCETVNTRKYYAYGLDKSFTNFRPGSSGAFSAAIEAAILKKQPIFFYYWGPTWLLGKVGDQIVALEEPPYDEAIWEAMKKPENPEDVKEATAYPVIAVTVSVNAEFHEKAPKLVEFLTKYETTGQQISDLLAWMQDNGGETKDAALEFLKTQEDTWTKWVPDDVADRVKAALSAA